MTVWQTVLRELYGLVIEDISLALGILAVVAVAYFVLPWLKIDTEIQAVIWVSALCAVLFENVLRGTRAALRDKGRDR